MNDLTASIEKLLSASEEPAAPPVPLTVVVEALPVPAAPVEVAVVAVRRKPWLFSVTRDANGEMASILATPVE